MGRSRGFGEGGEGVLTKVFQFNHRQSASGNKIKVYKNKIKVLRFGQDSDSKGINLFTSSAIDIFSLELEKGKKKRGEGEGGA